MLPDSICLVCGEPIIQPNYWQNPDATGCGNFCSMNYHHECYLKMREIACDPNTPKEVMRQFQRRAVNSAISMLNEDQGKAFCAISGTKSPFCEKPDKEIANDS